MSLREPTFGVISSLSCIIAAYAVVQPTIHQLKNVKNKGLQLMEECSTLKQFNLFQSKNLMAPTLGNLLTNY